MEQVNQTPLQMAVIPQSELEVMKAGMMKMEHLLTAKIEDLAKDIFVESEKARQELGVCPRTWQTFRDNRTIPFCQFGRKIWVRRADINNFIESHLIK